MEIFVYHTPELVPNDKLPACAVVIDVLRATSTIATVLHAGGEAVQAFSDMDTLIAVSNNWSEDRRLRAGERGGAKVEGCDLGNSPLDCTSELVAGKRLFISTTNGTRSLEKVAKAQTVIAAALINRQAVAEQILKTKPDSLWIVGSGWEGTFSLEDTVCAGAIVQYLIERGDREDKIVYGNDEVIAAIALYQQWQDNLLGLFHLCSHGQRLLRLNCDEDLKYCSRCDILDVLPIQTEPGVLVAQR